MHEPVVVFEKNVMCDGPSDTENATALGHPRIYLHIQADNRVDCPYCGKVFVYDGNQLTGN
jgi:uncharacterized Zn-finger protein